MHGFRSEYNLLHDIERIKVNHNCGHKQWRPTLENTFCVKCGRKFVGPQIEEKRALKKHILDLIDNEDATIDDEYGDSGHGSLSAGCHRLGTIDEIEVFLLVCDIDGKPEVVIGQLLSECDQDTYIEGNDSLRLLSENIIETFTVKHQIPIVDASFGTWVMQQVC
jgi:hypothetical protein